MCAVVYFAIANWVGRAVPDCCSTRDRWACIFMVLMIIAPLI